MNSIPSNNKNLSINSELDKHLPKAFQTMLKIEKMAQKPLSRKIINSSGYSLTAASALATLSYSICGMYNLQNQHYISFGVFTIIFFSSFMLFFVINEK